MRVFLFVLALIAAAPALAADTTPAQPGADKDKLICKRETPIGSLIATRKTCMTKEQWRKHVDAGNATARGMLQSVGGACGQEGGVCP